MKSQRTGIAYEDGQMPCSDNDRDRRRWSVHASRCRVPDASDFGLGMSLILKLAPTPTGRRAHGALVCLAALALAFTGCGSKPPTFGEIVAEVTNEPPVAPAAPDEHSEDEAPPAAAPAAHAARFR